MPPVPDRATREAHAASKRRVRWPRLYGVVRVGAALAIFAVVALRARDGWPTVQSLLGSLDASLLPSALLLAACSILTLPLAWTTLLRGAGFYHPGRAGRYLRAWFIAYVHRWIPGRVLLVTERARVGLELGIPVVEGTAILAVESALSIAGGVLISLAVLPSYIGARAWLVIAIVLGGVLFGPLALRGADRLPLTRRLLRGAAMPRLPYASVLRALVLYAISWAAMGGAFFLLTRCFVPIAVSHAPRVVATFALAATAGLLTVVAPAGLGVREGILTVALGALVGTPLAAALAVASRLFLTGVEMILFLAVLAMNPTRGDGTTAPTLGDR